MVYWSSHFSWAVGTGGWPKGSALMASTNACPISRCHRDKFLVRLGKVAAGVILLHFVHSSDQLVQVLGILNLFPQRCAKVVEHRQPDHEGGPSAHEAPFLPREHAAGWAR